MKKLFPAICFAVALLCTAGVSQAQTCSTANQSTLADCVNAGVFSCEADAPSCSLASVAVTIDSMNEVATDNCCGKDKKSQRKLCLSNLEARYNAAVAAIGSKNKDLRTFLRKLKTETRSLRTSDCNGNAYNDLF